MRRRDFVRAMVATVVAPKFLLGQTANPAPPPPAPVPWTLGLNPKTPIPSTGIAEAVAEAEPRFFTATQMTTLTRLCDLLLPPIGGKPGAVAAETPEFLDLLIGNSPKDRQELYQTGLNWLDQEAQRQFSQPFAKLGKAQADRLLKPWLRTWMTDHPPTEAHADFINIAHSDIRTATVCSKAWNDAPTSGAQEATPSGLYWSPIDPELETLTHSSRMRHP